jgi:hypothetical protein
MLWVVGGGGAVVGGVVGGVVDDAVGDWAPGAEVGGVEVVGVGGHG